MPPVLAGSWQLKSKLSRAIMGYHWHVLQRAPANVDWYDGFCEKINKRELVASW